MNKQKTVLVERTRKVYKAQQLIATLLFLACLPLLAWMFMKDFERDGSFNWWEMTLVVFLFVTAGASAVWGVIVSVLAWWEHG